MEAHLTWLSHTLDFYKNNPNFIVPAKLFRESINFVGRGLQDRLPSSNQTWLAGKSPIKSMIYWGNHSDKC